MISLLTSQISENGLSESRLRDTEPDLPLDGWGNFKSPGRMARNIVLWIPAAEKRRFSVSKGFTKVYLARCFRGSTRDMLDGGGVL